MSFQSRQNSLNALAPAWDGSSNQNLTQSSRTALQPPFPFDQFPSYGASSTNLQGEAALEISKMAPSDQSYNTYHPAINCPTSSLKAATGSGWPTSDGPHESDVKLPLLNFKPRLGSYLSPFDTSPRSREQARKDLEIHMRERLPLVRSASKTLLKMTDIRCADPFDVPVLQAPSRSPLEGTAAPLSTNPALRHLRNTGKFAMRTPLIEVGGGGQPSSFSFSELSLRERMLLHGKHPYGNQKTTELRSLTLHDWTPNIASGAFNNELLVHYETGEGCRLVMYEVDIPTTEQPPNASQSRPKTERWIWFLISTPVIMLHKPTQQDPVPRLPENLPQSTVPNSWMVFAAPFETKDKHPTSHEVTITQSVSVFPPQLDVLLCSNPSPLQIIWPNLTSAGPPFFSCPSNFANMPLAQTPQSSILPVIRQDYDFCKHGSPAFEVCDSPSRTIFLDKINPSGLGYGHFLCAKDVEGYESLQFDEPNDSDGDADIERSVIPLGNERKSGKRNKHDGHGRHFSDAENQSPLAHKDRGLGNGIASIMNQVKAREGSNSAMRKREEKWWDEVREKFIQDAARWKKIKEAMARGACRVIARFEVNEEAQPGSGDSSNSSNSGYSGGIRGARARGRGSSQKSSQSAKKRSFASGLGSETDMGEGQSPTGGA